ncbi:MAG TPA: membrane protein insertase YidC [Thermoanaerobaculia bacterium]|nr:membrane protein insertase YidC [Thermoanaerobaculia bacterium]
MEKRLLIAAALSIAVLLIWDAISPKPAKTAAPESAAAGSAPAAPAPAAPAAASTTASASPAPASPAPAAPVAAAGRESVVVERPLYRAVIDNRGAVLTSFLLKKYDDDQGHRLEMVHRGDAPDLPLELDFGSDGASTRAANTGLYTVERTSDGGRDVVRLRYAADGRSFEKTLTFGEGYVVGVRVVCAGAKEAFAVTLGPGLRNLTPVEKENRFTGMSGAVYFDGERARSVVRQKVESVTQGPLPKSGFVGLEDNYFLAVLAPKSESRWWIAPAAETENGRKDQQVRAGAVSPGELDASLYIGPKDLDVLAPLGLHLEETVSFRSMGINLGWIAKGLIWLLKASYRFVANWGVAILVVTFLIRLLLFPLMQKSFVGMKKMQKLQPKINQIRDRYKKAKMDVEQRNKMNQEMMALYQAEGYNPMSGCLPMLLQMPVLFAFYIVLERAIVLRHAPFALWIHDLSAKDPTYVLVVVMIGTMFLQQLMTPSTVDAAQRRMFLIMPLFWGFFMKDMPSGLVLYWLFSNVLTIAQQMLINRMYREEPAPAPRSKKSGSGKTRG